MALTADRPTRTIGRVAVKYVDGSWATAAVQPVVRSRVTPLVLRYVARRIVSWILIVLAATNLTYFLANWFLDPRANYLRLRRPDRPSRSTAPLRSTT